MNKKNLIGIGALTLALAGSLGLFGSKKAEQLKAADLGPYSIHDDQYEVAFLEQYNGGAEYGYTADKPLNKSALGGHIYGDVGGARKEDFTTNLQSGVNDTLTWRFTCGRVKNDTANGFVTFGIETHGTTGNILDATKYPEGTDEYAIAQLTIGSSTNLTECSAMILNSYIDGLNDFSVYWRNNAYGSKFSICYQVEGGSWKRLSNTVAGNYTGTRGWDAKGYTTFNSSSWTTKDAYQARVKLAFAVTNSGSDHGNFRPSAILINANNSGVRYLNTLSYQDNICSDNGENKSFDLNKGQTENVHNQDLFQLATERAEASFLDQYTVNGTKTSATSALDLYNHLVESVPGLGAVKGSAQRYNISANNKSAIVPVIVVTCVASVSAITIICVLKKRRKVNS